MASLASDIDPYWSKRLTSYYAKYNPEKLGSVNATLTKYKGYELKLFQALVTKYGPEPVEEEEEEEEEEEVVKSEGGGEDEVSEDGEDGEDGEKSGEKQEEEEEEDDDDDDDEDLGAMEDLDKSDWPVDVPFCPNCGLPFEYCEYSMTARFSECIPHLVEARPNMMLQKKEMTVKAFCEDSGYFSGASGAKKGGSSVEGTNKSEGETKEAPIDPNDPRAKKKAEKRERKRLANERKAANKQKLGNNGGPTVLVTIKNRTKKKFIVNINGMEKFGVKLKDAGKKLSKRYACSATVSKNAMDQKEIVMSGNIGYDIADVIHSLYSNIPCNAIIVEMKKKKTKAEKQVIAPQ